MDDQNKGYFIALILIIPGALAGLAALLRSEKDINTRSVLSAIFNSALFSAACVLLCFHYFGMENAWLCVGLSLLAGLGGNTTLGFGIKLFHVILKSQVPGGGDNDNDGP